MRAISKGISKELRHANRPDRQRGGFTPLETLLDTQSARDLFATQSAIRHIIRGDGGNHKLCFEIGATKGQTTVAIRSAKGHSAFLGVADDIVPVVGDLVTVAHGAGIVSIAFYRS